MTPEECIAEALEFASAYGQTDGGHHKMWVIDQMVRALTGCPVVTKTAVTAGLGPERDGVEYTYEAQGESEEYKKWVKDYMDGEDGPDTYEWEEGIPP